MGGHCSSGQQMPHKSEAVAGSGVSVTRTPDVSDVRVFELFP